MREDLDRKAVRRVAEPDVRPVEELPPGTVTIVRNGEIAIAGIVEASSRSRFPPPPDGAHGGRPMVLAASAADGLEVGYRRRGALQVAPGRDGAAQLRRLHGDNGWWT